MGHRNKLAEMRPEVREGRAPLVQLRASGEADVGLTAHEGNAESARKRRAGPCGCSSM